MSRFLFATVPADGHTLPGLPIARELIRRGHTVRWYGGAAYEDRISRLGARHLPMSDHDSSIVGIDALFPARLETSGLARLRFDMAVTFARPTATHLRDLLAALEEEPADLVVGDTGLIAGPILAELGGPPFAAYGVSVVGFPSRDLAPFGLGLGPSRTGLGRLRNAVLHRLTHRLLFGPMATTVNEIRAGYGLPPRDDAVFEYPRRASLYLQLGTEGFEYPRSDLPEQVRYTGPPTPIPHPEWQPPSWWADLDTTRPVVLVNQGTVATDPEELLIPSLAALAGEDVLVVAVTGGRDPSALVDLPANSRVERHIPFDRLLPHIDVFVTNGGFGGVQLALAAGVPIVAAGRTEDKIEVNARVAYSGVGINLRTQTPRPKAIRSAVRSVLTDPHYAAQARALQAEIAAAGRERAAADHLEQLVAGSTAAARDASRAA